MQLPPLVRRAYISLFAGLILCSLAYAQPVTLGSLKCYTPDNDFRPVEPAIWVEQAKRDEELKKLYGNQIHSSVSDDGRVKDHRTNVETTNVESSLDHGELDIFIDAELRRKSKK